MIKDLESKLEYAQDTPLPPYRAVAATSVYNEFTSVSLSVLNQIGTSINSIGDGATHKKLVTNKHFDTPKPVDPFYTGRVEQAEQLKSWLLPKASQSQDKAPEKIHEKQKRFVVYGVGGSGKTQFCCKFAEDNRDQ